MHHYHVDEQCSLLLSLRILFFDPVTDYVSCSQEGTNRKTSARQTGDLELEIRWFWRRYELCLAEPRRKMTKKESVEIFETDHIDRCNAASILAPVRVYFSKEHSTGQRYYQGKKV
mmetsp:Transcript_17818/g.29474  ORF Transcript_17818/g.29474 Transcript_17818/m.29474 type:complete len:116 (-) Transcript_17818:59-406(-)